MEAIARTAVSYAASHGIVVSAKGQKIVGANLSHAPMTALPSPVDSSCYEQALRLTLPLNKLVAAIAADRPYLRRTLADTAGADADFTGRLLKLLDVAQPPQTGVEVGVYRYDYFFHTSASAAGKERVELKMVEMNCIASSFASLGTLTCDMHRYLASHPVCRGRGLDPASLPKNDAVGGLAHGLASAHATFLRVSKIPVSTEETFAIMVVQPGEHNVYDQELLQAKLWENHQVHMVRMSLREIDSFSSLDKHDRLIVSMPEQPPFTVSLAYYRAGYAPSDYPTEKEWSARELVERSTAAKCPSVAVQLVGTKKIQQILDAPGEVERFVPDQNDANLIRSCFAKQFGLEPGAKGDLAVENAVKHPEDFVLKPQREGGGNNLYSDNMKKALTTMTVSERAAYVLMERLRPKIVKNIIVRSGEWQEAEIVSEFGVYGVHVTCDGLHVENAVGGTLLRSKLATQEDGGVAAGVAVLDSPVLQ